jgi:hypothetical protein
MRAFVRARALLAILLALLVGSTRLAAQDTTVVLRPTSELITREQIEAAKASTARELIEALHNNWLNERLPVPSNRAGAKPDSTGKAQYTADYNGAGKSFAGQAGGIQVYLDGTRIGGLDELKTIRPADIYTIRRINGVDAQARFGIGHSSGVLFITTMTFRGKTN